MKNKHSLTNSAPLILDLLHIYLNIRDDISLSQNFLHLRLLTAAGVDLARFFSYVDVKNRTFIDAKTQECDMWLRRRKGKKNIYWYNYKKTSQSDS